MTQIFVNKKFQFKIEYAPTLHVFSRMDSTAMLLGHDFPDWERSANWIELRNWERRQVLRIGFKESYFCCDDPPVLNDEVHLGIRCMQQIAKRCEIAGPLKAFADIQMLSEYDGSFDELVALMHRKFHVQLPALPDFEQFDVADIAYVIAFKERGNTDWYRKLTAGPMNRKEWLIKNPLTMRASDLSGQLMDRHKSSVPPVFIFASLDGLRDNLRSNQLADAVPALLDSSLSLANSFFTYCKA
jgi:hypothetical protein